MLSNSCTGMYEVPVPISLTGYRVQREDKD